MTPRLLERAVDLDGRYAHLNAGFVDASIMAIAERYETPILTFDFRHFRATGSGHAPWTLLVDEGGYEAATR